MKRDRYDLVIVTNFTDLLGIEIRVGPLLPLSVAWRLARRVSRSHFYRLAYDRKLRVYSVMGVKMVPTKDVADL